MSGQTKKPISESRRKAFLKADAEGLLANELFASKVKKTEPTEIVPEPPENPVETAVTIKASDTPVKVFKASPEVSELFPCRRRHKDPAARYKNPIGTVRINANISESIAKRAKKLSIDLDVDLTDLVQTSLQAMTELCSNPFIIRQARVNNRKVHVFVLERFLEMKNEKTPKD